MRCLLDKVVARYAVQGLLKLAEGRQLTPNELFTLDLGPMIRHWFGQRGEILDQLSAMQRDIPAPYSQVILPQVLPPEQIIFDRPAATPHPSDAPPRRE